MSTQYEAVNKRIYEEMLSFQRQLDAIQDDCIKRIKEIAVSPDIEEQKDALIEKLSNHFLFLAEDPESASVVIGTARAGHFSWRTENGFRDLQTLECWLTEHPEFSIFDEYEKEVTLEEFKEKLAWCNS